MFLDTEFKREGGDFPFPSMDYRSYKPAGEGNHQRAAVEFVLELSGKLTVPVTEKIVGCHSLLHADDIPVPMFSVDFDMRCVAWNKRAVDLTGWTEPEIFAMPRFHNALFTNQSCRRRDVMEDILKAALDGHSNSHEVWNLKTKWGQDLKVLVAASPRTVPKDVVSGANCVIVPLSAPGAKRPGFKVDCKLKSMDDVTHLDLEDDQFLAAIEQPPSPYSDMESLATQRSIFADQANMQSETEGTSVCSQDWCKSDQGSQTISAVGGSALEPSGLTRARVMVVDPHQRGRKSLTLMLERCGFEVSGSCSGTEALWRFEQTMHDPEGFSVLFISLALARADNYDLVRKLRLMEQPDSGNACLTTPALIVAVTDLDRWDTSSMEASKQRDIDAVIACPSRVQQLRDTLTTLGVSIDHLDYANKSPRAAFNSWNNPLVLFR